jgi:Fic family protein
MLDNIDRYKTELDKKRPFREPALLKELQHFYRVGLAFTSNALEGNSLTLSETKIILEDGITVGGKPLRDVLEAVGHGAAYDYMFSLVQNDFLSLDDIYKMHRLFYAKIDAENAGILRRQQVFISGSEHNAKIPQCQDLPAAMQKIETWMRRNRKKTHPVIFAARLHKKLAQAHPFIDGNGRICRLSMNAALVQNGYPPAMIPSILRRDYIGTLEKSWTDERLFIEFIAERVLEAEKDLMRMLYISFPG